jgi:hypothetical protein
LEPGERARCNSNGGLTAGHHPRGDPQKKEKKPEPFDALMCISGGTGIGECQLAAETGRSLPRHRRLDGQGGSGFPLFSGERVSRRVAREWSELAGIEVIVVIPQIGRDLGGERVLFCCGAVGEVHRLLVLLVWQTTVNELPRQNAILRVFSAPMGNPSPLEKSSPV